MTMGSPPRMRGKDALGHLICVKTRITPAYAGKSGVVVRLGRACWDHPRVCGEKKVAEDIGSEDTGSPPRMRGKEF